MSELYLNKEDELLQQIKTLNKLNELSLLITTMYENEPETLKRIVRFCTEIFEAKCTSLIYFFKEKNDSLVISGFDGNSHEPDWLGLSYSSDSSLGMMMDEILYSKKVRLFSDVWVDNIIVDSLGQFEPILSINSTIIIPLTRLDNYFGLITVTFSDYLSSLDQKMEELCSSISNIISSSLLNMKLYKDNNEINSYLTNLIKNSRDAIISLDLSGNINLWNQGASTIFGFEESEVIGRSLFSLFSSQSRSKVKGEWAEVLTGRIVSGEEGLALKKDEFKFPVSYTFSIIKDNRNKMVGVSIIFRDLTERKKLEKGILESKSRLQTIFDSLYDIIVLFDLDGKILMANKTAIRLSELPPRELIGKEGYVILDDISNSPIEFTKSTRQVYSVDEFIFRDKVYSLKTVPVFDSIGSLISIILYARDLTQEKSLYNQIIDFERMALIGELTSGITHELSNSLGIILNYSELLKEELPKSEIDNSYLNNIIDQTNRISETIESLNKFNYHGYESSSKDLVSIDILMEETLNLLKYLYSRRGIEIKFNSEVTNVYIKAYYNQIQQLIISIITSYFNPTNKIFNIKNKINFDLSLVKQEHTIKIIIFCSGKNNENIITQTNSKEFIVNSQVVKDHNGSIDFKIVDENSVEYSIIFPC